MILSIESKLTVNVTEACVAPTRHWLKYSLVNHEVIAGEGEEWDLYNDYEDKKGCITLTQFETDADWLKYTSSDRKVKVDGDKTGQFNLDKNAIYTVTINNDKFDIEIYVKVPIPDEIAAENNTDSDIGSGNQAIDENDTSES